jgi:myo-inositol 2-dehydrogenase/D-chiro-inositol 1-dehydrogenase
MHNPRPLSVGLIGAGGMGNRHAENLHRHIAATRVAAVYDLDRQRAEQVAAMCETDAVYDDPLRLIQDDRVEAVLVASPDATHSGLVLACLGSEKPILCEKPLATTAADAARVVAAESALGRRLVAVGLMRRFDPCHVAVRQVVASQQLGRPILYKGVHRNAAIPYDARGEVIVTNSAGHDIDTVRWLLGQEIKDVYVRGVRSHATFSADTTDLLLVQMTLTGDCLATIELYMAAEYGYEVSAEIVSERGAVVTGQPANATIRSVQARSVTVPLHWLDRFQEAYVAELAQWVRSIRSRQPFPGANAWDGYMALLVTDACVRSLRSRSPVPVEMPPRPVLYEDADDRTAMKG